MTGIASSVTEAPSSQIMIQLTGCTKSYGKKAVLKDISFEVSNGSIFVSILGKTGSGKTTLLRLIAGLEEPDAGKIYLNGKLVSDSKRIIVSPHKRNIGFIFQDLALWPHFTVEENILFPLKVRREKNIPAKISRGQAKDIAGQTLQEFGITDLKDSYPHRLSGGQQQLVALARSVILHPKFLLMDEPLANLDVKLKSRIRQMVKNLVEERKITVLYVTHDHNEALSMGDKVLMLNEGGVVYYGEPSKINQSDSSFVRNFIEQ